MAPLKKESKLSRLKRRTRKIKASTIEDHLREFGDNTTLHGIHYVSEMGSHFMERLFWVIAIVICAVLCSLEVSKLLYRWQNSPVIISIAPISTSVTSIPYPALTICPENKVKRSFVDMQQNLTIMKAQLNGTLEFESEEQKLYVEAISLICLKKYKMFSTELLKSKVIPRREHLNVIAEKISPKVEDVFEACYLNSKEIECSKLFRPIMLFYGMCFTFNTLYDQDLYNDDVDEFPLNISNMIERSSWNPEVGYISLHKTIGEFPHRETRSRSGLQVILKSISEDLQDICTTRDSDTFRITVQAPHVLPDSKIGKTVHASPGIETVIALRPTTKTTAPELHGSSYTPKIRGCYFPEERKLRIFKEYTLDGCILECLNDFLQENCGCQIYYLPSKKSDNLSFCPMMHSTMPNCHGFKDTSPKIFEHDIEGQIDLLGEVSPCDCLPSCSDIKYQFHASHEVYKNIHSGDGENSSSSSANHAIINMYFESPTFFGKRRSELYGITDFIASCGGLLGLFTGFSLITAIEIFYFTTLRLFCKFKRNHNNIEQQAIKQNGISS